MGKKLMNSFGSSLKYVCDFETTVYDGQESTEVWAAACVPLKSEKVLIFHSIDDQLQYFVDKGKDIIAYYHNLKFDGAFWVDFLIKNGYKLAQKTFDDNNVKSHQWLDRDEMPGCSFKLLVSALGDWYTLTIRTRYGCYIELRDSLKLLPFSVKQIGKAFKTKHQKLDMEYEGFRYAGCEITPEEQEYIKNDVLVVKEALEIMFEQGHKKLTIGSCCMAEFKKSLMYNTTGLDTQCLQVDIFRFDDYEMYFPDLTAFQLDESIYGATNCDAYIRKAYRGGWCYLVEGKENTIFHNGTTADVNSLYPSMMHSESGNYYPIGKPHFWNGNYIPDEATVNHHYFYIRIKTRFYIKENMLPFVQIKHSFLYKSTEMLKTSDVYDKRTNKYYKFLRNKGEVVPTRVELTLTMTDFQLLKEHYDLVDFEILDGCWFASNIGIFDKYINKWREIKQNSTGAIRQLAKLFLNNCCGKFATSTNSSYKVPIIQDGVVNYFLVPENNKQSGYIAIGAAVTSYSRNFTIRAAQSNYYGVNKRGFIYADTDSIHCDLSYDEIKNINVHPTNFCCWKLESGWDVGIFERQKTYIEHVIEEDQKPVEAYYNIKCAGMPESCKRLFNLSMRGNITPEDVADMDPDEIAFVNTKRTLKDFTAGLNVPGKLLPKRIKGGVILQKTTYEMR